MKIWDWKYRIFFEDSIQHELKRWQQTLSPEEAKVYDEIGAFYCSFYSFGMLLDNMLSNREKAWNYLQKAINNKSLMIKTPNVLLRYYRQKIRTDFDNPTFREKLDLLLTYSLDARQISPEYWDYIAKLFGSSFGEMYAQFSFDGTVPASRDLPRQRIISGNCKEIFDDIYGEIVADPAMADKFHPCAIRQFRVQIMDGNGYGEWWDREISNSGKDELILYTNENKAKSDDYKYTIIHETYPGHGHFYNYVRAENDSMDHGAMSLIEGWATFCEWNTYPSAYVDAIRQNAIVFLWESSHLPADAFADAVAARHKKKGKTFKQYVTNLKYATQYIGFTESYYLGALWMETVFRKGMYSPKSFLDMLRRTNKGEFFRLWQ